MKYFGKKRFKMLLKLFLIMSLFFLLVRFFFTNAIEEFNIKRGIRKLKPKGKPNPTRGIRRGIRRASKLKPKHIPNPSRGIRRGINSGIRLIPKQQSEDMKKKIRTKQIEQAQNKVGGVLNKIINNPLNFSGNISNCAVPYNDDTLLQLSESGGLFKIFGNDRIVQCEKNTPKIVQAKTSKNPSGIKLSPSNSSSATTNTHMRYGDEVSLCSNSNIYKLTNTKDASSSNKIKYGDNLRMIPISEPSSSPFNVTVNPNVYGLSGLYGNDNSKLLKEKYVDDYAYCGNSTSDGVIMATDD